MSANARLVNTKQLRHRFLRSPNRFIFDNHLHSSFLVRQLVQYELYLVTHVYL